jgi:branched-chain amino acid aminotransferase
VIIQDIRQNETSPLTKVKSLNHYFYIWMSKRAERLGADEAIILNSKGNICECSRSNIFIVKKGVIFTPPLDSGCLAGITRHVVIEIAQELKLDLFQMQVKPKDLLSSDEAFVTNSLIEVMPLTWVDNKVMWNGKVGRITRAILEKYRDLISKNYK